MRLAKVAAEGGFEGESVHRLGAGG